LELRFTCPAILRLGAGSTSRPSIACRSQARRFAVEDQPESETGHN